MPDSPKTRVRRLLEIAVAITPWLISMYFFYWLDASQTWTSETAHRGKLSVIILASGMLLSFLVHAIFSRRNP
jgi:hypothetical protein